MKIDPNKLHDKINKYWIGYLTGILIFINLFSAGVILSQIWDWDIYFFIWIYFISLIPIVIIKKLIEIIKKIKKRK